MDTRGGVKLLGLTETIKGLRQLGASGPEISAVGYSIAQKVAIRARRLAPHPGSTTANGNASRATGRLAKSIQAGRMQAGANVYTRKPIIYAAPIHWGWPDRNIRPNVFMLKAIGSRKAIFDEYRDKLNELIRKYNSSKVE